MSFKCLVSSSNPARTWFIVSSTTACSLSYCSDSICFSFSKFMICARYLFSFSFIFTNILAQ
ncbi:hypothetical protein BDY19DRAFT_963111 [Irpex rosettiformis]|uniref:Uncharacterized protein n=1 Tax=Irpex rosettiformis TaxID=378272 RepID=A0ACB8TVL3_9APHY|nr:hypothetical protein BDY19DRAFT_963111 [Irpex rosettiformis]